MKRMRILAGVVAVALLLPMAGIAEELGEMDLYAPEIYEGEYAAEAADEAPAASEEPGTSEPLVAEASVAAEPTAEAPVEDEVLAPETEPTVPVQAVALTGRKATARMNVAETLQITLNEGEAGAFASKSPKIATVDASGLVTALAKGTAKIEFKPEKGKKRTLSVKVVDPYEPTGVSVGQGKAITLDVGDALRLDAVLAPETARTVLTWKSGKAKVASVDGEGTVTALAEGKAKLTVTTANKKKATVTVTVRDPYKPSGVSIAQGKAITLNVGDALRLDAVLAPETARTVLTWKSGKAKVASVDGEGTVTALAEGQAKLTVTTANKKKATVTVTVVNPYKPSGVSIDQGSALQLMKGERVQLSAALAPETARATLTWKSSKAKVATVDSSGLVTAVGSGKATITVSAGKKITDTVVITVIDPSDQPRQPAMNTATYNGVEFKVVNTAVDPFVYAGLVRDKICTSPGGTGKYSGYCLGFCNYYVSCMVDNVTDLDLSFALSKYRTSKKLSYTTEKYGNANTMMARLYDLLSAGQPQILMVEAITHPGSRHFVVVVGHRASVTRREDLRPEDLLIIDSYDGKLESMDPAIEPVDARVLFKKEGKYRIEAVTWR